MNLSSGCSSVVHQDVCSDHQENHQEDHQEVSRPEVTWGNLKVTATLTELTMALATAHRGKQEELTI